MNAIRADVLTDIHAERSRQNEIHPIDHNLALMYLVLSEEVGEVAEALQIHYTMPGTKGTDQDDVYRELIEVAAVAARMAEQVKAIENASD